MNVAKGHGEVNAALGCRSVSSRRLSIRFRASVFNITSIQVYAFTPGHNDNEIDHLYEQLQKIIDQIPKKDNLAE